MGIQYAGLAARAVPVDTAVAVRTFEIGATVVHRDPHFGSVDSGVVTLEAL